ncbi:MAG TPA: hypothetical protein VGX68_21095 [Thermoanaerobaculia bacterium]|jgi:hypothetical protein|nr:hypothetical protein [Thermoanaerobaculia bacterium]
MPTNDEPEPLPCAQCGRPLAEPTAPCSFCEEAGARPDAPEAMKAFRLLVKSRAQLLFAFWGWTLLLAPLAAWNARRGSKLALSPAAPDPRLARRLQRIFVVALLLLGVTLAFNIALRLIS